ncbi:hypothetical protein [Pseudoalteromonas sp. T1lg76]|uniref:hypothetical protein n=1 Tax=Pseudoalteromonas sp. T1lg76 TaxID=2077103 RepID=UPI001319D646|nr:hypothetical protein [Pseudoalteromonas sp. T1lg76]
MNTTLAAMHHQGLIFSANQDRGAEQQESETVLSSGFSALDRLLGGGWPQSGVIHLSSEPAIGEFTLLQGALVKAREQGLVVLINPPAEPCIQWLLAQGVAPARLLILRPQSTAHALWAAEQCSRSSSCALVWLWHQGLSFTQARRFSLACQQSQALLVLVDYQCQSAALPVQISMRLQQQQQGLQLVLLRQQGRFARGEVTLSKVQLWPFLRHSHKQMASSLTQLQPAAQHYEVG